MSTENGNDYWRVRYLRHDRVGPCVVVLPADSGQEALARVERSPCCKGVLVAEPADTIEVTLARPLPGGIYPREALQ